MITISFPRVIPKDKERGRGGGLWEEGEEEGEEKEEEEKGKREEEEEEEAEKGKREEEEEGVKGGREKLSWRWNQSSLTKWPG